MSFAADALVLAHVLIDEPDSTSPGRALVDEFGAEFAPDPPCQAALPGVTRREDDGELRRNLEIFGNHLDAAVRNIRDRAVARQRGPRLDLRYPPAWAAFGLSAINEH